MLKRQELGYCNWPHESLPSYRNRNAKYMGMIKRQESKSPRSGRRLSSIRRGKPFRRTASYGRKSPRTLPEYPKGDDRVTGNSQRKTQDSPRRTQSPRRSGSRTPGGRFKPGRGNSPGRRGRSGSRTPGGRFKPGRGNSPGRKSPRTSLTPNGTKKTPRNFGQGRSGSPHPRKGNRS